MTTTTPSTEASLAEVFSRWARRDRIPGLAWGLVRDGELASSGGLGVLRVDEPTMPDADSVFRIASMTKSFTGAALMTLVVDGRLRLDDPVARLVPELADWRGPTTDGAPITLRHLVSMESGLPTDDTWADRHLDLPPEAMDALIGAGAAFAWTPGTRFEYSNLGWGLIGRVIERVAGVRVQDLVAETLLEPLGMTSTTWVRPMADAVAEPYRVQDGVWLHDGEPLGDGSIAPMGGIWTTVRDLGRWVAFFLDACPPRDGVDHGPLPRWARREMQRLRAVDEVTRVRPSPSGPSRMSVTGYGVGLGVRIDERLGTSVGHSGGLPGYGSHMRWLPEHGLGVVGLSNVTYGNMHGACMEALEELADLDELEPAGPVQPSPSLADAATKAAALLSSWNDDDADALFADNVGLDESYERRGAEAARLVARAGSLEVEDLDVETPLRGTFTSAGGAVRVEIGLNHERRVQWLDVEDRSRPSDLPIVVDEQTLRRVAGTAHLIVRPTGDLADAFARWQGEALDRLGRGRSVAPGPHATLKTFGSSREPLEAGDDGSIVEVAREWAAAAQPLELRAEGLGVFEQEGVPVVRLTHTDDIRDALGTLRAIAADRGLPAADADIIDVERWIPHLSLVYTRDVEPSRWRELVAWTQGVSAGGAACRASVVEVVVYDGGPERRLALIPLGGDPR